MLGGLTWSRLVRIENTAARSAYPAVVDALIFEEAGLLWFYTPTDGTQSLSLHVNRLAEEKAHLAPLLQAIDPGFVRFEIRPDAPVGLVPIKPAPLSNGCFVECLAALRGRVLRGEHVERPRLFSCYTLTAAGLRGHTVLTYETSRGFFLLDPSRSSHPRLVRFNPDDNPMSLAEVAVPGAKIVKTRWLAVGSPEASILAKLTPPSKAGNGTAPRIMQ